MSSLGRWVTLNNTHLFIAPNGVVTKGPASFIGKNYRDLPKKSSAKRYVSSVKTNTPPKNTISLDRDYGEEMNNYIKKLDSDTMSNSLYHLSKNGFTISYTHIKENGKYTNYTIVRDKDGNLVAKLEGFH